jgi:hypothetical protein
MRPNFSYKINLSLYYLLLFVLLSAYNLQLNATIRYVSHTGSSTPPYTTWATAADSIQKCINISLFGDTIYVANGVYEEQVVMIPGISLIGAGADSCIIDVSNFPNPQAVGVSISCLLKNFKIIVQETPQTLGTGIVIGSLNSIVEYNVILNAHSNGIWCYNTNSIIRHNRVLNCERCITIHFNQPIIDSNYICPNYIGRGIITDLNGSPIIRGNNIISGNENIFTSGFVDWSGTSTLLNNLFLGKGAGAISSYEDIIENNIVFGIWGNWATGIIGFGSDIKNNNIENTETGLYYDIGGGAPPTYRFNNMWNNDVNFENFLPDTTNLFVDPMFVDPDSMEFHLQKYSPLIDAGDPNILDKDSSRSDIGLYGGPYGESYIYVDLPPRSPVNLTATVDSLIKLNWNTNTEADFNYYNVYRDTTFDFTVDSTKLIATVTDTFYYQTPPSNVETLYYKLTAVDNQENESNPSEQVSVKLVSVKNEWVPVNNYILYQNYPNPFNPSTKIGYKLKEGGYVKLYVYSITGELVSVLVNQTQEAGYYEVNFDAGYSMLDTGNKSAGCGLASGVYIYQIMIENERDIPVFSDIKKMIYLK